MIHWATVLQWSEEMSFKLNLLKLPKCQNQVPCRIKCSAKLRCGFPTWKVIRNIFLGHIISSPTPLILYEGGGQGGQGETFDFLKRRPLTSRAKMIPCKAHTFPPLRIPYISCGPSPKKWNSNKTFFRIKSQKEGRPKSPKFCLKSRCFDFAGLSALSVALPTFFAFIIETHHICIFLLGH